MEEARATAPEEPSLHALDGFDQWYRCKHREGDVPPTDRLNRSRKQNKRAQSQGKTPPPNLPAGVLTALWLGRNDPASPLARLSGHDDVLRTIIQLVQDWYRNAVSRDGVFVSRIAGVAFPQPSGLYCNMMPIRLPESIRDTCFRSAFDDSSSDSASWQSTVPKEFHGYLPLIASCPLSEEDEGAIGYLTVDERTVEVEGASQRRAGLHAESPGLVALPPACGGGAFGPPPHPGALTFFWGGGHYTSDGKRGVYAGGVYMASTVTNSCRVWNAQVREPAAMGALGDLEHLRPLLGTGTRLQANELVWMTDTTPHESLPLAAGTTRSYFRLVTSKVSAWYAAHSTPNPLGITPPPEVPILHVSKFARAGPACAQAEAQGTPLADAPAPSTDRPERQRSGSGGDERDAEAGGDAASDDGDAEQPIATLDGANRRLAAQREGHSEGELQGAAEELARTSLCR